MVFRLKNVKNRKITVKARVCLHVIIPSSVVVCVCGVRESGLTRNFLLLHLKIRASSPVRSSRGLSGVLSKVLGASRTVAGAGFVSIRSLLVLLLGLCVRLID